MAVNTEDPYAPESNDIDPEETGEWVESLDAIVEERGAARGREIMTSLLARSRQLHGEKLARVTREARLSLLTPKERQIADLVVAGKSSPKIAQDLNISVRTVENHRARLMEKLHVESIAELVKLFL